MDKALIVGIADYAHLYGQPLTGARNALGLWKTVLTTHFGFKAGARNDRDPSVSLHTLESGEATKDSILTELRWLVDGAMQDDRIVFIFGGHGTVLNRPDPRNPRWTYVEQGLVVYPRSTDHLDDAVLFGDEIADVIRSRPVRVTAVIDCCYGQGVFDDGERSRARTFEARTFEERALELELRPLYIDATKLGAEVSDDLATMELVSRLDQEDYQERSSSIVIMSGARDNEPGFEGQIDGTPQLLFSYHLVDLLNIDYRSSTYTTLCDALFSILRALQTPQLQGTSSRYGSNFTL